MERAWFKMEADILQDPEIETLMEKHGHEIVTAIVSVFGYLRSRKLHKCKIDVISKLARRSDLKEIIIHDVVHHSGLFEVKGDHFFNVQLSKDMKEHDKRVVSGSKGGKQRALNARQILSTPLSTPLNNKSKSNK